VEAAKIAGPGPGSHWPEDRGEHYTRERQLMLSSFMGTLWNVHL
jgi:hypothetical protein